MQLRSVVVVALVLTGVGAETVSPIQKVLTMMANMKVTGAKMMKEEATTYAAYTEWVADQKTKLGFEIVDANQDVSKLTASIGKANNDVARLGKAIAELASDINTAEKEKKAAAKLRAEENAAYQRVTADYAESIDAVGRALQTMTSNNLDVPQASALLQTISQEKLPMRRVLAAFLQLPQAPAAAAYESKTDGIVKLLEDFQKKFKAELDAAEDAEANQAHNSNMEVLHLDDTIENSNKDLEEKTAFKAKRASDAASDKESLASSQESLADSTTTLKDNRATFAAKTATFKVNQKLRKEEIGAINKAVEIISSQVNLIQAPKSTFLQVRSEQSRVNLRHRVASFLAKKATALSSQALKNLAEEVQSSPFDKIIKNVRGMLSKLKQDSASEADHKEWCDGQLKANKAKRDKKTSKVDKLTADIELLTETIKSMGKKIGTLSREQADVAQATTEATSLRQQEKAANTKAMKDSAAGAQAVDSAIAVLQEFYSKQASFVQQKQAPEMAEYKVQKDSNTGVVGMLEVIASDFTRVLADTTAAEESAVREYSILMADSQASKEAKHKLEVKTSLKKDQKEFEKLQAKKDLSATQEELNKALAYQKDLKPLCLEVQVSYKERVAARKDELDSLQDAYASLSSDQ